MILPLQTEEVTSTPKGPITATAVVTIRIKDVNDQTPSFEQSEYTGTVMENTQERIPISFLPDNTAMTVWDLDQVT